jgi:hypothetical protein
MDADAGRQVIQGPVPGSPEKSNVSAYERKISSHDKSKNHIDCLLSSNIVYFVKKEIILYPNGRSGWTARPTTKIID